MPFVLRAYHIVMDQHALQWFVVRCHCFIVFYVLIDSLRTSYLIHSEQWPCLSVFVRALTLVCCCANRIPWKPDFIDKKACFAVCDYGHGHATMRNEMNWRTKTMQYNVHMWYIMCMYANHYLNCRTAYNRFTMSDCDPF